MSFGLLVRAFCVVLYRVFFCWGPTVGSIDALTTPSLFFTRETTWEHHRLSSRFFRIAVVNSRFLTRHAPFRAACRIGSLALLAILSCVIPKPGLFGPLRMLEHFEY